MESLDLRGGVLGDGQKYHDASGFGCFGDHLKWTEVVIRCQKHPSPLLPRISSINSFPSLPSLTRNAWAPPGASIVPQPWGPKDVGPMRAARNAHAPRTRRSRGLRLKPSVVSHETEEETHFAFGLLHWVTLAVGFFGLVAMLLQVKLLSSERRAELTLLTPFTRPTPTPLALANTPHAPHGADPATAELARQLDAMQRTERPPRALRRAAPTVPKTTAPTDDVGRREATTMAPAERSMKRWCDWSRHPGKYLGELLDEGKELSLLEAQERCFAAGAACPGVTCSGGGAVGATRCTARRGLPYLAVSPSSQEVSYTKRCPERSSKPPSWAPRPSSMRRGADSAGRGDVARTLRPEELLLVVIAHNRPDCLEKCLKSLSELQEIQQTPLAVSLDEPSAYETMEAVVHRYRHELKLEIWHKVPYAGARGPLNAKVAVSRISEHFRFVLEESFVKKGFEFAVFLENDLLVAPDFLWLFRASAWLLTADPSLFCVSAWNDNGFSDAALLRAELNATRLFRTDYFPGLGWMIQNTTWFSLRPSWPRYPSTGWDHWLRHGGRQQLELAASAESGGSGAARECVAPEVSRTHHFDQRGTNVKVGTPMAKKLSKMAFSTAKPHELGDLSYLLKENYQDLLHELLRKAILVSAEQVEHLEPMKAYLVPFVRRDYKKLAQKLQITEAQPRSSHEGLIATRDPKSGAAVFLANRLSSPWLPSTEQAFPHEQRHVAAARPGESCADMCQRLRMICSDFELEFINDCAALKAHFPCEEGCGHQVGEEIPCYVHEASRDTGKQCLVTDDAIPRCGAKNQATSRLCSCIPA